MSSGKWKGLRLGTQDKLPMFERIARQKEAAYIYLQQGNIDVMLGKLKIVARLQNDYESFIGREVPSFLDYESIKSEPKIIKQNNFKEY